MAGSYEWRDLALVFQVVNMTKIPFAGVAYLGAQVEVSRH